MSVHSIDRRRQALTEYIILVGLVAVLLISGVSWFGFRVDEAYDGSNGALQRRVSNPMSGPPPAGTSAQPVRVVTDAQGNRWDVYDTGSGRQIATPQGTPPSASSPTYDPTRHGR